MSISYCPPSICPPSPWTTSLPADSRRPAPTHPLPARLSPPSDPCSACLTVSRTTCPFATAEQYTALHPPLPLTHACARLRPQACTRPRPTCARCLLRSAHLLMLRRHRCCSAHCHLDGHRTKSPIHAVQRPHLGCAAGWGCCGSRAAGGCRAARAIGLDAAAGPTSEQNPPATSRPRRF